MASAALMPCPQPSCKEETVKSSAQTVQQQEAELSHSRPIL